MKTLLIAMVMLLFVMGTAFAQMGGGPMGGGMGSGHMGGGQLGGGMGSGMHGAGGMTSGMMGNTMSHGYLGTLNPLPSADLAEAAIQAFITASNSSLQISELWEYETAYIAELSDTNGEKALDLVADKFTGSVLPEMGFSMMMNASYGRTMYKMPASGKNLKLTPVDATNIANDFITENGLDSSLGYTLVTPPETYPGYYKFHTTSGGNYGMDIMVNGYSGGIWMNTLLGAPLAKY